MAATANHVLWILAYAVHDSSTPFHSTQPLPLRKNAAEQPHADKHTERASLHHENQTKAGLQAHCSQCCCCRKVRILLYNRENWYAKQQAGKQALDEPTEVQDVSK
jgi:hypothetical protein